MQTHIVLYVQDQQAATNFYSSVLKLQPTLNVGDVLKINPYEVCNFLKLANQNETTEIDLLYLAN